MQPTPAGLRAAILFSVSVVLVYLYLGYGYVHYDPGEKIGRGGLGRAHSMQRRYSEEYHPESNEMVSQPDLPWPFIDVAIMVATGWGVRRVVSWAGKRG